MNRLRDPNHIHVGQKLFIPGAARQLPVEMITPTDSNVTIPSVPKFSDLPDNAIIWPIEGGINSRFGRRGASFHDGIDISAQEGTPIRAIEKGEVIYSDQLRGYGNLVILRHAGGLVSVYAHNQVNLVAAGQFVAQGDIIAKVGSTGRVTGPHLHLEIRKNNVAQDPLLYLPQLCCRESSDIVERGKVNYGVMSMKELANIRNDVVGSLLRPAKLKEARVRYDEGRLSATELRADRRSMHPRRGAIAGRSWLGDRHRRRIPAPKLPR